MEAVVVACHQNQCRQNFNTPLLPSGQYAAMVLRYLPEVQHASPFSSLEARAKESIQKKEKAEKVNIYLRHNF
jgi:hypothetical protein